MYNRRFLQTKLGRAALASVAAMTTFVVLSTQIHATPALAQASERHFVELA